MTKKKMNLICGETRREMEEIAIILQEEYASSKTALLDIIHSSGSFNLSNAYHGMDLLIHEELDSRGRRILDRISSVFGVVYSDDRQMQLQFSSCIRSKILTSQEIKGEGDASMQIALIDASTGNRIVDGPYASASIEIVVLKGNLDALEGDDLATNVFEQRIVQEIAGKKGKKPLVLENALLKLQRGMVDMQNVKFRHDTKRGVFHLGARMADLKYRNRVKEAVTNCFTLKDYRGKYHMNHEIPCLKDSVSRLVHIGKGRAKRLQEHEITTVKDFLIQIMTDPDGLSAILKFGPNEWKETVDNARACSDKKVYRYSDILQKKGIVFDISGEVLGLYMNNQYAPKNTFSENHKAEAQELKASAYKNWSSVMSCKNENSGQEYFNEHLGGCCAPRDLPKPNYPASNEAQKSCSKVDIAPESMNPMTNLDAETSQLNISVDDYEISIPYFPNILADIARQDVDGPAVEQINHPYTIRSILNPEVPCISDYDGFFLGDDNDECDINSPTTETNAAGSKVAHSRNLRMRWRRLLCLAKWHSAGKKFGSMWHNLKKQKVH